MKPFIITFANILPHNGRDLSRFYRFRVNQGKLSFPVNIAITSEAICNLEINDDDKNQDVIIEQVFLRIGLQRLREKLGQGNYPKETTINCEEILITSANMPLDIQQLLQKKCGHQRKGLMGPVCNISMNQSPSESLTTPFFCDKCSHPDSRLMCSHLIHPMSQGYKDTKDIITSREIIKAYCNKGEILEDFKAMCCVPVARKCWEQIYETFQPAINIPVDLSDRVADEIDFLNLLFDKKYNKPFLMISQARSIRDSGSDCKTKEEFIHKIQVIGHLINDIKIRDILIESKSVNEKGGVSSITALKRFLEDNYPNYPLDILSNFEHIRTIRDDYPTHTKTRKDITASFDFLRIEFPVQDWQKAWEKVLYAFWNSLYKLRLLVNVNTNDIKS
ncbi:MAG: hypothetical protein HY811_04900 [Planctomycetes bacterium]|nr:hypothetical protein [Planctomycetota bacterium]